MSRLRVDDLGFPGAGNPNIEANLLRHFNPITLVAETSKMRPSFLEHIWDSGLRVLGFEAHKICEISKSDRSLQTPEDTHAGSYVNVGENHDDRCSAQGVSFLLTLRRF